MHVLFGTVLALDNAALIFIAGASCITLFTLAVILRPLALECADAGISQEREPAAGGIAHIAFLCLMVVNLVAGFQALGTLLSVGIMMLPAIGARFWSQSLAGLALAAFLTAALSSLIGLLASYHLSLPSGPAIILTAGGFYVLSVIFGPVWRDRHAFHPAAPSRRLTVTTGKEQDMLRRSFRMALIVAAALAGFAAQAEAKLKAVASFSILGDMVCPDRRRPRRACDAGRAQCRHACL